MSLSRLIKKRRSVRAFLSRAIEGYKLKKILEAGRWAPSGLNNQPWRFVVIKNKAIKDKLSVLTEYSYIIKRANCLILVFLDKENSYNFTKDVLAIGACIENMLLCSCELKVGSCWLGEILNQKIKVNRLLKIRPRYELMAVVAFGYFKTNPKSKRICLDRLIIKEII